MGKTTASGTVYATGLYTVSRQTIEGWKLQLQCEERGQIEEGRGAFIATSVLVVL